MSFSLLESKKPAEIPLSLNWAKAVALNPVVTIINKSRLNLFMMLTSLNFLLNVLFLDKCGQRAEDDLHVEQEVVRLSVRDV